MSTFNETGLGGALIAGCVLVTFLDRFHTTYGQGDIAYNVNKAKVGVLERVVIKKQRVIRNLKTQGMFTVLYIDTLNALWNEFDLVSFSEAKVLATAHIEDLLNELGGIDICN